VTHRLNEGVQHWHRQLRDSDADKQTNLQTGHPKGGGKGVAGR